MSNNKTNTVQKLVSVFILWCMVASGIAGIFAVSVGSGSVPQPVRTIVPSTIDGYVEVRDQGVYDVDFGITINAGGTLKIVNSTLNFRQNDFSNYYIDINANGNLILENSTITTGATPVAMWDPFIELTMNGGTFKMSQNSVLAFPGWLNLSAANVYINDSWITSLIPDALTTSYAENFPTFTGIFDNWWAGTERDLSDSQDDGPIMKFTNCDEVVIADSRIDEMYEDANLIAPYQFNQFAADALFTDQGTGGISSVSSLDGTYYSLDSLETIRINGFDTQTLSDATHYIVSTELYVVYNNPGFTYSLGYDLPPFNGFNYSVLGSVPETFAFQVQENQIVDTAMSLPITSDVNTFTEIGQLFVNFTSHESGADNPININSILLNVTSQLIQPTPNVANLITLDNTDMTVINSYIAADWSSISLDYMNKNAFELTNGANLYMYNMTIEDDEGGVSGVDDSLEIPIGAMPLDYVPFRIETGSNAYYFKWLETSVVDKYYMPISGARLNATFHFTEQSLVNTVSSINDFSPGDTNVTWANTKDIVTDYLFRTNGVAAATFNATGATGKAIMPMLTTFYSSANYPNGEHVGEYEVDVIYTGSAGGFIECDFLPMPNIAMEENSMSGTVQLTDIELSRPFGSPGLIVNDNDIVSLDGGLSDSLSVNDFIIVEDNGILTISNAALTMAYSGAAPFEIIVRNNGQLIMDNVDLKTQNNMLLTITLEDSAVFTMVDSTAVAAVNIMATDSAEVNFNRTDISGNFDTAADANVMLNAWSTMFSRSLDDFHGTSEAVLVGCYSPLSPNFRIEPSDSAVVWNYRWTEVTVLNGLVPATPLANADITIESQYTEWATLLNRAGTTNSAGVYTSTALADYFRYDPATSQVVETHYNLYTLETHYQLGTGINHYETTGLGVSAYPLMGITDAITKKTVILENVLPDLDPPITVWPIGANDDVGRGNEVWINTTISNAGDAVATGINVRFNDLFNGDNTTIFTAYNASMGPGTTWDISFPYTWDSVGEIGWHNITVYVDPLFTVEEQNETNNFNSTWINVTSQADLAITQYSDVYAGIAYPVVNESFDISANIWNLGDLDATDVGVNFYRDGVLIGATTAALVPADALVPTTVSIPVTIAVNGTYLITVVIDESNAIPEVVETNNNNSFWPLILRVWEFPNLFISNVDVVEGTLAEANIGQGTVVTETNNRTTVVLRATVTNNGELFASNVMVRFYDGAATSANLIGSAPTIASLSSGSSRYATISWVALTNTLSQTHNINAIAYANNDLVSNLATQAITVIDDRPDIELVGAEFANNLTEITGSTIFNLNVTIANNGPTNVESFNIEVYSSENAWNTTRTTWNQGNEVYTGRIGNATVTSLVHGEEIVSTVRCTGVETGDYRIYIVVDPDLNDTDAIDFDSVTDILGDVEEYEEQNNNFTISGTAIMPPLMVRLQLPDAKVVNKEWTNVFVEGETSGILVTGFVVRVDSQNIGVPGVNVTATIAGGNSIVLTTGPGGYFTGTIPVSAAGNYTVSVSGDGISADSAWFRIDSPTVFPWWIIILIVVLVVVVIVGITLYLYFVGLGKTVQCGDCGAFIPEGASKCPKCGVEFETEVAKCSVCGAWVPIDVKNCPECGTEFTVGTEDLDDYEAKMKRQYEDIVRKFREQAKKELGQEFTETEFQAWWASKPTFITFDLWLKEEEEMKRMGSRPCPVCEMENSVTAKICHKCGSVMGDAKAPAPKKPEGKLPPTEKKAAAPPTQAPAQQPKQQPQAAAPVQQAPPQQAPAQQPAAAAPVPAQQATPGKKGCPSCGMEVNAAEKICPICSYDFGDQSSQVRVVRKPIKKIVRRPGEPGGDQPQQ